MSNYNKLKVITVVGTRPEIIRLSRIINYFDESFEHILVHTGQNYDVELNEIFFKDLNILTFAFFCKFIYAFLRFYLRFFTKFINVSNTELLISLRCVII
jgi:hypothetical protein